MSYLLVLHDVLDDNLVDEIKAAGARFPIELVTRNQYIEGGCGGSIGLRFNDKFEYLGHAAMRYYRNDGSQLISGYTEINLDQFLELLGIKESKQFEDELMQLLGG